MALSNKTYRYSIYSQTGDYIGDLTDVVSDPSFYTEINSGPADLTLQLARPVSDFDEGPGHTIWFENELRLYAIDKEAPQGQLIYSGRLNEYRPHFGPEGEWIQVQFMGYVTQLGDRLVRDRTVIDFSQSTDAIAGGDNLVTLSGNTTNVLAMKFRPSIPSFAGIGVTMSGAVANPQPVVAGIMYADTDYSVNGFSNVIASERPGVVLASGVIQTNAVPNSKQTINALFPQSLFGVDTTRDYFCFIAGSGIVLYTGTVFGNDVWGTTVAGGAENRTSFSDFNTTTKGNLTELQFSELYDNSAPNYLSQDPTAIVQDILTNKYSGKITYDAASSQATGTTVSYQFNKQTVKDSIQKLSELAPPYWFWRVNADNSLTFKRRDDATVDHILSLGQHIYQADTVKTVNEMITRVIFYGGSDVGKPELLFVDDRPGMQTQYTLKEKVYVDGRVLLNNTASGFTRDVLDDLGNPAVNIMVTVLDSNGDQTFGYDIESFKVGQRVQVVDPQVDAYKNIAGSWDNAVWDADTWDETDNYIFATPLQIIRIDYIPDQAILTLANILKNAAQRIRDDQQNLAQTQTANAPTI